MRAEFPKLRVKNCFLSKGEGAARVLAKEIGGITDGKLKRWFEEWTEGKPTRRATTPASEQDLAAFHAENAKAWHRSMKVLADTRAERMARAVELQKSKGRKSKRGA